MPEWSPHFLRLMKLRQDGNYNSTYIYRQGNGRFLQSSVLNHPDDIQNIEHQNYFIHLVQNFEDGHTFLYRRGPGTFRSVDGRHQINLNLPFQHLLNEFC